ncbi:hypothetical protein [Paracidovorax anthurii]|uniref:Uncharacterized protein n=1 Tax=Paracidovorax anthurii TaxID=78229 RepID=A0A328ZBV7_9BURK|nr:hypothetical protein [Paracidovorax anthurii]RAR82883.1 hypothetical protein AX018_101691 [Paracidovorax anthurii]
MNDFLAGVIRWTVRLAVVAVGAVFFLCLLVAVALLALAWGVRMLWARITGQPVTPWVMRMDPREGWSTVYRSTARWSAAGRRGQPPEGEPGPLRSAELPGARTEVADVQPRDVH